MTDYIVKCAEVSWTRHSTSVFIGDFLTKNQRENRFMSTEIDFEELEDGYGDGSPGIYVTDDFVSDRFTIWRPPFSVVLKRAALVVSSDIPSGTRYVFTLYRGSDSQRICYLSTQSGGLTAYSPSEMTIETAGSVVEMTDSVLLDVYEDRCIVPIVGLTVVLDYEPYLG